MDPRTRALREVSKHCDIEERLTLVPPSAVTRGLYFRSLEARLAHAGQSDRYHSLFPQRYAALGWYPTRDYLERVTIAAGMLRSPEHVHEGLFELARDNARAFTDGVLGQLLIRFLARDPMQLLKQGLAGRRQSAKPARWELSFPDERTAVMHLIEEYLYIESYELGAAHGTFEAAGLSVRIECQLEDRFVGKHIVRW
ncbi:MAG TPA: TIGR02265 family protein [Polyangiales bacterium]|nr:TIGR02265 family protein [Polyangiales bacterium]